MPRSPHAGPTGPGADYIQQLNIQEVSQGSPPVDQPPKMPEITLPGVTPAESIYNRVNQFGVMARRRPFLVGALVGSSSLSDYTIGGIASGLQSTVDWTDLRSAAAGVPGYLAELQNMLLQIPVTTRDMVATGGEDPTQARANAQVYYFKQDALKLIDAIQRLGPNDQSLVLSVLSGHPLLAPIEQRVRAKELTTEVLSNTLGATTVEGHIAFDSQGSATTVAALFPNFPVALIGRTNTPLAQQLMNQQMQSDITRTPLTPLGDVTNPAAANYAFSQILGTAMAPFDIAGKVLGFGAEHIFPGNTGTDIRNFVGGSVRGLFKGLQATGDIVIKPALDLAGLKPGDPSYDTAYQATQFLWQILALSAIGKGLHADVVAGRSPSEISAAELGLRGAGSDYVLHPITRVVWDLRNKTPGEWVTETRAGRQFVSEIINLKNQGGDIEAAIAERWGGAKVPGFLAKALNDASIADVPRVLIDAFTEPGGKVKVAELASRKATILQQLEDNAPVVELPREPTIPAQLGDMGTQELASLKASSDFVYHGTSRASAIDIAETGLEPRGPEFRAEQQVWPDGGAEPRVYFSGSPRNTIHFLEPGQQTALLRVRRGDLTTLSTENTGDFFATEAIPPSAIEFLAKDGTWRPISELIDGTRVTPRIETPALTDANVSTLVDTTLSEGGATWDPRTNEYTKIGEAPPDTYGVAVNNEFLNIERPSAAAMHDRGIGDSVMSGEVNRVLAQYPDEFANGARVGTWWNKEDGNVYVDPMRVVTGKDAALLEAAKTGQKSILDFATGDEISVPQALIDQYAPKPRLSPDAELALRGELLVLDETMRRAAEQTPLWRFPKKNILRASLRHPLTMMERIINLGMKPLGKVPEWLVDELPTYPTLYSPIDTKRPLNWLDHNADVASKWLRRTGVQQDVIEALLNDLFHNVKTGDDFFTWVRSVGDAIDSALPRSTPPDLRQTLTEFWDRPAEARTRSVVSGDVATSLDGTPMRGHQFVLRDDAGNPLPSMPTEFAQSIRLPSVDHAIEATSILRRGMRELRKVGIGKLNLGLIYDVPKFFLQMSTILLKPLVLIVRLPALVARIQMEQFIRAWLHEGRPVMNIGGEGFYVGPGGLPIPGSQMRVLSSLFGEDGIPLLHGRGGIPLPENVGDLGMMMSSLMDLEGRPMISVESTSIYNRGGVPPKPYVFQGWADSLLQLHNDRLVMEFARRGLDVDKMVEFLSKDDWGKTYLEQQRPGLERSQFKDLSPEQQVRSWLELKKEQILQQTAGGDPELLDLIRTGKLRRGDITVPRDPQTGISLVDRYVEIRTEIARIEDAMHQLDRTNAADRAALRALDESRRDLWRQMKAAERGAKVQGIDLRDYVQGDRIVNANKLRRTDPIHETKIVANALRDRWQRNEFDLPDHVAVSRRVVESVADPGVGETMSRIGDAYSRIAYSPLKALTKADIVGTRGSLYYDIYRRAADALERQGWAASDIPARATLYAAERVSNIMYDLGAKTSMQRALKDLFWFAPAWQEIIYTWGVKLPSQYHWPLGVPLLMAKGQLVMDILRASNVIQKNAQGDDIIVVPTGAIDILAKMIPGFDVKIPDKVYFRTQGLNFVTSGGIFPGLSSSAGFLLGKASLKYGGVFKELSDVLQPFGPEAQWMPSPLVHAYELMFGHPPGFELFSPEWQKAQYDRTNDVALQYAFADLREQGINPPHITDFKNDAKYQAAFKDYWDRLFSLSHEYLNGMLFTKLIGSTIAPASLSYTRADEEAWKKFWTEQVEPGFKEGGVGFTEEQRQLIDGYLADHPNSLGYSTFYTAPGVKSRDLPFSPTADDNIWDEYYTGERRYKTPEEFALTLAVSESRRFLVAQLDKAMQHVGDTASEQLRNGFARASAVGDYLYNWDRYKEITPGAEAILKQQQQLFAEKYGIPVKSYEQERLAQTINYLNRLSPFFTNEAGMRTEEVRAVLGQLKQLYSDTGEFGTPNTPVEKARAWYFENVLGPYIEKTSPLYEKAQELDAAGLYAGNVYDRIRQLNDRLANTPIMHKGEQFPTPEEVFFGNRSPEEQSQAILTWATRPPAWLSDFQREQVGLPSWDGAGHELAFITNSDANFYDYIAKNDISTSSKEYDTIKAYYQRRLVSEVTDRWGEKGRQLLDLQQGAPYTRLESTVLDKNYITDNYGSKAWNKWKAVTNAVEYVASKLTADDVSPRGFSEEAVFYKAQLYSAIAQFAKNQPEFRDMMRDLSYALPQPGLDHRSGALLFNALFFNNFDTQYVPDEITRAGAGVI